MSDYAELMQAITGFIKAADGARQQYLLQVVEEYRTQLSPLLWKRLSNNQLNHAEMTILDYLAHASHQTVAYCDLVAAMPFSQGLVSRYLTRLAKLAVIEKFHKVGNRKTVYLTITEQGKILAQVHQQMHVKEAAAYHDALAQVPASDVAATLRVIAQLRHHAESQNNSPKKTKNEITCDYTDETKNE